VDLDGVESVSGEAVEEFAVVAHEPDDEFALGWDAGVDAGVLDVLGFSVFFEDEADLGVGLGAAVDLAGACLDFVSLWLGGGGEGGEEEGEEEGFHGKS
jgi:hypothetical protein